MRRALAALAVAAAVPALAADNPASRFRTLSEVDCPSPSGIIAQSAEAPANATYLRVQHMGDPGTDEWLNEVANPVTWDVGSRTGYSPPPAENAQRGYRDIAGYPAFQLGCGGAGFHIDTAKFSHKVALVGEGPSASVARDFATPKFLYSDGSSLLLEATIALPTSATVSPPVSDGTAQLSFFYYVRDSFSGGTFAHLVALYDNRSFTASAFEAIGSDGASAFVSSPLAWADARGAAVKYAMPGPSSATMRNVDPWATPLTFRAVVTQAQFEAMLAALRAGPMPQLSPRPGSYRVTSFGVLAEVFPGTGTAHEVVLGGSVTNMALREQPFRPLISR